MALILDHFYSAALTECNSLTAIVPMENNEKSSYPVLWLLPPAGCDLSLIHISEPTRP